MVSEDAVEGCVPLIRKNVRGMFEGIVGKHSCLRARYQAGIKNNMQKGAGRIGMFSIEVVTAFSVRMADSPVMSSNCVFYIFVPNIGDVAEIWAPIAFVSGRVVTASVAAGV